MSKGWRTLMIQRIRAGTLKLHMVLSCVSTREITGFRSIRRRRQRHWRKSCFPAGAGRGNPFISSGRRAGERLTMETHMWRLILRHSIFSCIKMAEGFSIRILCQGICQKVMVLPVGFMVSLTNRGMRS